MAYLIFTANGYEIDRRELSGPAVIGRAPDADFHIRDILLSRHHCKIEPGSGKHKGSWIVTDLGSKNGTTIGSTPITRHTLRDGDELRIGRTRVTFRAGEMDPNERGNRRTGAVVRPADPAEALEGTVSGFILVEPDEVEREAGAPIPKPRPPEPNAYNTDDVYGMLNEIASSSWDSIQEQASRPIVKERPLPRPRAYAQSAAQSSAAQPSPSAPQRIARGPRVAMSLQAHPEAHHGEQAAAPAGGNAGEYRGEYSGAPVSKAAPMVEMKRPRRPVLPRALPRVRRSVVLAGIAVAATLLLVGGWLAVVLGGARYEMRRLANANPPRVTSELLIEPQPIEPVDHAAPASQAFPPDGATETGQAEPIPDETSATFDLPPRRVLIAGLRDAALHELLVR